MRALELGARDYIRKPFNIDELRLVVSRALKSAQLEQRVKELEAKLESHPDRIDPPPLKQAVEEYERALIQDALRRSGGVQTRAAEQLGTTRRILRYRIDKLQIEP
jgi:DNA-binding NtrC family response regulator